MSFKTSYYYFLDKTMRDTSIYSSSKNQENLIDDSFADISSPYTLSSDENFGQETSLSQFSSTQTNIKIQIQNMIEKRYGKQLTSVSGSTRNRLRQYLYRYKDDQKPVDINNVIKVMDFLDEVFEKEEGRNNLVREIIYSSPRILKKNVECQLKPAVDFLNNLYGYDMFIKAISCNPDLLMMSGVGFKSEDNGFAVSSFLQDQLDMTPKSIESVKKTAPTVFQLSVEKNIEPIVRFLASIVDDYYISPSSSMNDEQNDNQTLSLPSKTRKIIARLVTNNPSLLHLSIQNNLQPTVEFLRNYCYMDNHGLGTLIRSCPGILGFSVEDNLLPTVIFLMKEVGLSPNYSSFYQKKYDEGWVFDSKDIDEKEISNLKRCLSRHPQILGLSIDNLKRKVDYFDAIDSLSSNGKSNRKSSHSSLATRIAISAPSTFSLSLQQNIIPKVQCLAKLWGVEYPNSNKPISMEHIIHHSLTTRLSEYPAVLTLSLEGNIEPTIQFYNRTGYVNLNGFGELIIQKQNKNLKDISKDEKEDLSGLSGIKFENYKDFVDSTSVVRGRHLATSLFNRLLPRWHFLMDRKSDQRSISLPPPIHVLASATDEKFSEYYDIDPDEYQKYKKDAIPRLKFSTQFVTWIKTGRPIDGT